MGYWGSENRKATVLTCQERFRQGTRKVLTVPKSVFCAPGKRCHGKKDSRPARWVIRWKYLLPRLRT